MHRRAFLGAVTAGVVGTAGCLTTLGLAERGPVTAKYIVRVAETESGNVVYDAVEGERYIAPEHEKEFPAEGRIYVSQDLHRQLNARYVDVRYHLRHECRDCGDPRLPEVGRGDFNSVGVGDVASLTYSESGERATVVAVTRGESS
jgi:hypothetical protein